MYWEDRITPEEHQTATKALERFKKSRKSKTDQHICYEALTNAGVEGDEADEIINLAMEDE